MMLSCQSGKTTSTFKNTNTIKREIIFTAGPQAIVYKTFRDYSNYVPMTMNKERSEIVSYPSPSDVVYKGILAKPTPLKNGYWLDNRGINENTVFTDYTYEEYSKLKASPSINELKSRILDKHPFLEMINCGIRTQYADEVAELNQIIDSNFEGCKKILSNNTPDLIFEEP